MLAFAIGYAKDTSRRMITQDRLKELLNYDPLTGVFTHAVARGPMKAGATAGYASPQGYWRLHIDRKKYFAHRLAWFYTHGEFPPLFIDHIDGNKLNNAITNLRAATHSHNMANVKNAQRNNKSGLKGVNSHPSGWFQASIKKDKVATYLGCFKTPEEAHEAYRRAHVAAFGEFSPYKGEAA